jgi:hypothetical protein
LQEFCPILLERTFGRFGRLGRDFKYLFEMNENVMHIARISILLRRLVPTGI